MLPGRLTVAGLAKPVWLRLEPVSHNDAAMSAWRVREPAQIDMSLLQLAKEDGKFIEALALVAMSVAAPRGFVPHQPPVECMSFRPSPMKSDRLFPGLRTPACNQSMQSRGMAPMRMEADL